MKTVNAPVVLEANIRPMKKLEKLFQYAADNSVTLVANSKLTAPELVAFLSERIVAWGSESIRLANTLRIARMLPPVKEGEREVPAFKWAIEKLKANSATASTFTNIAYLVPAIDVKEANGGAFPDALSPFAVKNALGWLREKGVIDEKTGKLDPVKSLTDPVVKRLKEGVGASKLASELKELRKPAETTTPAPASGTTSASNPTPAVEKGADTPAKVALDLALIVGRVDKLNAAMGREKVAPDITGAVKNLALLAGFDLVAIQVKPATPAPAKPAATPAAKK